MMEILQETTVWEDNTPNHTYAVESGTKVVGYLPFGSDEWIWFTKPLNFSKSRRTFRKLKK